MTETGLIKIQRPRKKKDCRDIYIRPGERRNNIQYNRIQTKLVKNIHIFHKQINDVLYYEVYGDDQAGNHIEFLEFLTLPSTVGYRQLKRNPSPKSIWVKGNFEGPETVWDGRGNIINNLVGYINPAGKVLHFDDKPICKARKTV